MATGTRSAAAALAATTAAITAMATMITAPTLGRGRQLANRLKHRRGMVPAWYRAWRWWYRAWYRACCWHESPRRHRRPGPRRDHGSLRGRPTSFTHLDRALGALCAGAGAQIAPTGASVWGLQCWGVSAGRQCRASMMATARRATTATGGCGRGCRYCRGTGAANAREHRQQAHCVVVARRTRDRCVGLGHRSAELERVIARAAAEFIERHRSTE